MLFIGADHRGFEYKEAIKRLLNEHGIAFEDCGDLKFDPDDNFPEFAFSVADKVAASPDEHLGLLFCGSGSGVAMAANKVRGVRAAVAWSLETATLARQHDFANVLAIPANHVDITTTEAMVLTWLNSQPLAHLARYVQRINEISNRDKHARPTDYSNNFGDQPKRI